MSEIWTILRVLTWTQGKFTERGIATARLDAELLLAHVLKKDRIALYTHFDQPLAADELASYRELIKQRLSGKPIAYLTGRKEFRSLELQVDARVLIPRPDTETLVEVALEFLDRKVAPRVVDIGTGSGAIALAIKKARPDAEVMMIDRSLDALTVARENARRLALDVRGEEGDLLSGVAERFELIVSNPPYIPTAQIVTLSAEVRSEPMAALDGGADGLDLIRRLSVQALSRLVAGGALAMEIGAGQADEVRAILLRSGFESPESRRDLGGIDRVIWARSKVAV